MRIIYSNEVKLYLKELIKILFEKEYFGFEVDAEEYVNKLIGYINENIFVTTQPVQRVHKQIFATDYADVTD